MTEPSSSARGKEPSPETSHGWDAATARWYAAEYGDWPPLFPLVRGLGFAKTDNVLDIGCGTGSVLRHIAGIVEGQLVGIDPTAEMVEIARSQTRDAAGADRIVYHLAPAEKLPVADDGFEVVLAINSLHHWSDAPQGLREVARVLSRGGRLIIAEEVAREAMHDYDAVRINQLLAEAGFRTCSPTVFGTGSDAMRVYEVRVPD